MRKKLIRLAYDVPALRKPILAALKSAEEDSNKRLKESLLKLLNGDEGAMRQGWELLQSMEPDLQKEVLALWEEPDANGPMLHYIVFKALLTGENVDEIFLGPYGGDTTIPPEIERLKKLRSLTLTHGQTYRELPSEMAKLKLDVFEMVESRIGKLPSWFSSMMAPNSHLTINECGLMDISGLKGHKCSTVDLQTNRIRDLSPAFGPSVKTLAVSHMKGDLKGISACTSLHTAYLWGDSLILTEELLDLPKLKVLYTSKPPARAAPVIIQQLKAKGVRVLFS